VIEQKINEFFGDAEATGFGSGWWSAKPERRSNDKFRAAN
jgi:hypothetical protein